MDIHAVIFDWDGVIVDTMSSIALGIPDVLLASLAELPAVFS